MLVRAQVVTLSLLSVKDFLGLVIFCVLQCVIIKPVSFLKVQVHSLRKNKPSVPVPAQSLFRIESDVRGMHQLRVRKENKFYFFSCIIGSAEALPIIVREVRSVRETDR